MQELVRTGGVDVPYTTDDLIEQYNCGDLSSAFLESDSSQVGALFGFIIVCTAFSVYCVFFADVRLGCAGPVARFQGLEGQNKFFGGTIFVFFLYVYKQIFWAQQNLGGHKKIGGTAPGSPLTTGLVCAGSPQNADTEVAQHMIIFNHFYTFKDGTTSIL